MVSRVFTDLLEYIIILCISWGKKTNWMEPSTDTKIFKPSQLQWLTGNKIKDYSTWLVFLSIIKFSLEW